MLCCKFDYHISGTSKKIYKPQIIWGHIYIYSIFSQSSELLLSIYKGISGIARCLNQAARPSSSLPSRMLLMSPEAPLLDIPDVVVLDIKDDIMPDEAIPDDVIPEAAAVEDRVAMVNFLSIFSRTLRQRFSSSRPFRSLDISCRPDFLSYTSDRWFFFKVYLFYVFFFEL